MSWSDWHLSERVFHYRKWGISHTCQDGSHPFILDLLQFSHCKLDCVSIPRTYQLIVQYYLNPHSGRDFLKFCDQSNTLVSETWWSCLFIGQFSSIVTLQNVHIFHLDSVSHNGHSWSPSCNLWTRHENLHWMLHFSKMVLILKVWYLVTMPCLKTVSTSSCNSYSNFLLTLYMKTRKRILVAWLIND